jgi:Type IV secretion system proteins
MKRLLLVGVCTAVLGGSARAQGIAVHDEATLLEEVQQLIQDAKAYALQAQQWATQNLQWLKQVQQYATQLQQYAVEVEQFEAFVHNPNLGVAMGLLNQAGLGTTMPVSPNAMMSLVNGLSGFGGGGIPNLAGIAAALGSLSGASYTANHVYSPTDGSWNSQQLIANANGISATQGTALASYQQLQTHAASMQALRNDLYAATDPKDVYDAQAEIELESLWTANQQASLAAVQVAAQTQDLARMQRDNESLDQGIDRFLAQAGIPP